MIRLEILWIAACIPLVFSASVPIRHDYDNSLRDKRSASGNHCGSWSTWVNKHTPTTVDKDDAESMSPSDLEAFCPYTIGGNITKMRCKDDKGEPFFGKQDDLLLRYSIQCFDISVGVVCTATNTTWDRHCPDLSVSYFCTCGKPPLVTSTVMRTKKSTPTPRAVVKSSPETTKLMDEMHAERSDGDDGTLHINPKLFFYSSVATGSCLLMLITMSCIITCLLCKRKGDGDPKRTEVRPF